MGYSIFRRKLLMSIYTMNDKNKVAIFYPYVAHYRFPVFEKLLLCEELKFHIYSDDRSNLAELKTCEYEFGERWTKIRNYWLGERILFQPAIIKNAFWGKEQTVIYLGNMWYVSTWIASVIAKLKGKKVLMWTHGVRRLERGVQGSLRRFFYRLADGLLLYGHKAKRLLAESGYPQEKMHVIYNSLDYEHQKNILNGMSKESRNDRRSSLFCQPELPILLTLGRMVKRVNYPLLLETAKKLCDAGYPVNILIVGDGPERESVENSVSQYGLDGFVNLYGACYDEVVLGHLINAADITIGPGHIGLACIHSLIYGTPVFCHNDPDGVLTPEFEVVRDSINGGIFKKDDPENCALKIRDWLEKHQDRAAIEEVCKNSIVPHYTPDYQVEKIVRVILSLRVRPKINWQF